MCGKVKTIEDVFKPIFLPSYFIGLLQSKSPANTNKTKLATILDLIKLAALAKLLSISVTDRKYSISTVSDIILCCERLGNAFIIANAIFLSWKRQHNLRNVFATFSRIDRILGRENYAQARHEILKTIILVYFGFIVTVVTMYYSQILVTIKVLGVPSVLVFIYTGCLVIHMNLLLCTILQQVADRCDVIVPGNFGSADVATLQKEISIVSQEALEFFQGQILPKFALNYLYVMFIVFTVMTGRGTFDAEGWCVIALCGGMHGWDLVVSVYFFNNASTASQRCVVKCNSAIRQRLLFAREKEEVFFQQYAFEKVSFSLYSLFPFSLNFLLSVCGSIFANSIVLYQMHMITERKRISS